MRKVKKLLAVLLAAVMMLAMGTTAFATETSTGGKNSNNGTITIDNAVNNQTYNIYKIFQLESYSYETGSESSGAYAYTITSDSKWYNFVKPETSEGANDAGAGSSYVSLSLLKTIDGVSTYYVTWNEEKSDYATFAKLALAYAQNSKNNVTTTATASTTTESTNDLTVTKNASDNTYTIAFSGLNLGYYLVDSSLGTLCSLDTTNPNVTIQEKNEEPTNIKTVLENSTNNYGTTNDANIGDTVNFQSTIIAKAGADSYVFHDKMSNGLTFESSSTKVYKMNTAGGYCLVDGVFTTDVPDNYNGEKYELVGNSNYTLNDYTNTANSNDSCTFEIQFTQDFCDKLIDSDKLVISYFATLNENAVVGNSGNSNESWLDYGDDSETTPSITTTYTWELNVFKYTGSNTALAGAKFKLVRADNDGNYSQGQSAISFVDVSEEDGLPIYRVATTTEINDTETQTDGTITTTEVSTSPSFKLNGLDAGTYYLVEIKAPNGYNELAGPVKVVISSKDTNGAVTSTETVTYYNYDATNDSYETQGTQATNNTVRVLNNTGSELPSTGGTGTTIFYVLGAILVIGAGVLLVVKRRMGAEK